MVKIYDYRCQYMLARLSDMRFVIYVKPTGAFYVFTDARRFCKDSYKEAFRIIEEGESVVDYGCARLIMSMTFSLAFLVTNLTSLCPDCQIRNTSSAKAWLIVLTSWKSSSTEMVPSVMPGIRSIWPMVAGAMRVSLVLSSLDNPGMEL